MWRDAPPSAPRVERTVHFKGVDELFCAIAAFVSIRYPWEETLTDGSEHEFAVVDLRPGGVDGDGKEAAKEGAAFINQVCAGARISSPVVKIKPKSRKCEFT